MTSPTEENYLKTLFHLTFEIEGKTEAGTNELAEKLSVTPATVNNMLKRLKEKGWINYEKYGKITLTSTGKTFAIEIVRKHRLWETFLFEKLSFSWDEVHEVAEQLEHIKSEKLVNQIEFLLDYPKVDPHGDLIPNEKGEIKIYKRKTLSVMKAGGICKFIAVKDNSVAFLKYIDSLELKLNDKIKILSYRDFDGSMAIEINQRQISVSKKVTENLFVEDCK